MKITIHKLFVSSLLLLGLTACEKEEDRAILLPGTPPELSISTNDLVLAEENAEEEALDLSWTESDFGFEAAVQYSLQIDTAGDNFTQAYSQVLESSSNFTFKVAELNELLLKLGFTPEEAHEVNMRIKADLPGYVEPVFSNTSTVTVTPYSTYIEPAYIYVPGGYQSWKPAEAPALVSFEDNGVYEGVISITGSDLGFKFTPEKNWELAYGQGTEPGTLSTDGGNITVEEVGTYYFVVDLNELTWSAELYSWGIVGDATPGGWPPADGEQTDTPLVYNGEGVWETVVKLTPGALKFRLNEAWTTNYGDDDLSNNLLNLGGENIPITEAGTYSIILDLSDAENPAYTITKVE